MLQRLGHERVGERAFAVNAKVFKGAFGCPAAGPHFLGSCRRPRCVLYRVNTESSSAILPSGGLQVPILGFQDPPGSTTDPHCQPARDASPSPARLPARRLPHSLLARCPPASLLLPAARHRHACPPSLPLHARCPFARLPPPCCCLPAARHRKRLPTPACHRPPGHLPARPRKTIGFQHGCNS